MFELIAVAASNPHFIFFLCNVIIVTLILVSLEPSSHSDHKHTPTPIPPPPPPPPVVNENKSFATATPVSQTAPLHKITTSVLIDVDPVSYDDDCNLSVNEHEEDEDELRRRVEEFIEKVNRGWKAEKLTSTSNLASFTN